MCFFIIMDVYSLLSIVKSYYRPDNYDLHVKLCIASKKYYEFTTNMDIELYFDAIIYKSEDGIIYKVCGVLHRLNGPAYIKYNKNGQIIFEEYYYDGFRHNENGPAYIRYFDDKSISKESYYIHDKLHRENGPASIVYHYKDAPSHVEYYINGKRHSDNGPAYIEYDENGNMYASYYIDGKHTGQTYYSELTSLYPNLKAKYNFNSYKFVRKN